MVDDNVDGAESLSMLLGLGGYEVRTAHDGPGAVAEADRFRPDAVFLDIGLPGLSGYEVAERLRVTPAFARTLLVAVTGWGQDTDRRRSAAAGFDHHLVKPVDPDDIRRLLAGAGG